MLFKMTFSQKLYLKSQIKFWLIPLVLIGILVVDVKYGISRTTFTPKAIEFLIIFFSGFALFPVYRSMQRKLDDVEDKILNDADHAKLGIEGEKTIYDWLERLLPKSEYKIFHNVVLPHHKLDIDFVIIGPKGILVLEVKNYSERLCFQEGEYFLLKDGRKDILPPGMDPRGEARRHAYYLREFFKTKGLDNLRILKAVVFPKENAVQLIGDTGIYIVSGHDALKKYLDGISKDSTYTPEFCKKLEEALI